MILHTLAVIVLALLSVHAPVGNKLTLRARTGRDAPAAELTSPAKLAVPAISDTLAQHPPVDVPLAQPAPLSHPTLTPLAPQTVRDAVVGDLTALQSPLALADAAVRLPGGGLGGRSPEGRKRLGQQFGATPASEQAVELALRWLADHQSNDGGWTFYLKDDLSPCEGRCENPPQVGAEQARPRAAATGLSLLAFLGAGYTHQSGRYSETVRRGLYFLRGQMRSTSRGGDFGTDSMYGHAMATLAMAEAAAMTDDPDLREAVSDLTTFIISARNAESGWGYNPGGPGDITLTGWQVMALLGAKRLHIALPTNLIYEVRQYVDSLSPDQGIHFGYKDPTPRPTTTAIGLTIQMYLGRSPEITFQRLGLDELARLGPLRTNVYHNYYASLALHHARHAGWEQFNQTLREHLVATQSQQGHMRGSWHFPDRYGDVGGRLYTTAMCAMILEIYYRYLPLYSDTEPFPL